MHENVSEGTCEELFDLDGIVSLSQKVLKASAVFAPDIDVSRFCDCFDFGLILCYLNMACSFCVKGRGQI